ncbi:MAG: AAA family ATPase [Verrucomicrobia bacterium]|nr:AAA family ATPase [Verrucomicrobiota bacterium]
MITPFIPTPEELAESERVRARQAAYTASVTQSAQTPPAADAAPTHTQSTGSPAPLPQVFPGTAAAPYSPAQTVPGQPPPRPPLAPCVLTAAQLAALVIPPRTALLDRWLCQGDLGYIFAPRGVGKTWMAMAVPGAISTRSPLGLWQAGDPAPAAAPPESSSSSSSCPSSASPADDPAAATSPAESPGSEIDPAHVPVLYVDGEMALNHTQCRSEGLQLQRGHVHYLHHEHLFELQDRCINIGEAEDRQRLTDLVLQQGYRVLILDNLSSLASGIDENKGMDYEPIANWLLDLRRRKITVIMVHHAGRSGLMRGHSKREDACAWIIELRDARQETDPGAKFVSHFAKPSRNTGDPLPDMLWHFVTDKATGITDIKCELAVANDYETFILHVLEGVTSQKDIAEMMNKNKGTISKWARKALDERRISGSVHKLMPPKHSSGTRVKTRVHADDDDWDEDEEGDL